MEKTIPKAKGREVMKTVSLIDLCYSVTDCPHSTPKWTNAGKIVIRNQNIRNGRLDISSVSYTTQEDYDKRIKRALPNAGDIIITREAPMGEVCMIPDDLECCLGQRMVLLKPNRDLADNNYLLYALMSPYVKNQISWSEGTGTTVSNLRIPHLEKLQIPIFELKKQRKIAKLLANLDKKIEVNNEINDNLQQQTQAIYDSMFIENANPAWQQGHLSDLVTVKYGKDHKKLADGCYPVYGSGGIMRHVERPLYDKESVLIPRKGTLNNVMYVNQPFWSVDTMFYTEMRMPNVAKFIYHFVKGKDLASMNAGSAVPSMTTDILNAMEVAIPSATTLAKFEILVAPMYRTMQENNNQSAKLAELRDTLLPKLMSGQVDVSGIQL